MPSDNRKAHIKILMQDNGSSSMENYLQSKWKFSCIELKNIYYPSNNSTIGGVSLNIEICEVP